MQIASLWYVPLTISLVAALVFPLAALGTRFDLWGYKFGFLLLTVAWGVGCVALLGCGFAFIKLSGTNKLLNLAGTCLALAVVIGPLLLVRNAKNLPSINDISTDTSNPPEFSALLPLRAGAETPSEYPGEKTAERQKSGYPDLAPKILAASPQDAYKRALDRAKNLGWNVVGEDPAAGRFEAWERTTWFGFTDDIVVRVTPDPVGAKIDVRSHSRVGKSDMGANAKRIIHFLSNL